VLRQALPDLLELAGDEGVTPVGRMDVEVEKPWPFNPKPPLDRHESLPTQGCRVKIDKRDSGPGRRYDHRKPETERLVESL